MDEKQYFAVFFLVTGLLLGCAAMLSYIEDPGGVFTKNLKEREIAEILLSGHNAANVKNYDERLLQKDVIQNDPRHNDLIVLGSSRVMQIRSSDFEGKTFFNHGVSGVTIEDIIAILELYLEKGDLPGTIIIGVDPWILNTNNNQIRWHSLQQEYMNGIARIFPASVQSGLDFESIGLNVDIDRYKSLLSRPIIIDSIKQIFSQSYYPTDRDDLDVGIVLKDGSYSDPLSTRTQTVAEIDSRATIHADGGDKFLQKFTRTDEGLKNQFESTIHYLKEKNVTVILFLAPYHPIVYKKFMTDPQYTIAREVEAYFKDFAAEEGLTIIGSYDPGFMNLTSEDFTDGMHPNRETVKKIFLSANISNNTGNDPSLSDTGHT